MHQKQWDFLQRKFEQDRLSHAYVISGGEGIGKKAFVNQFLRHIQCQFPDVLEVKCKEGKDEIEISQVRDIQAFLRYAPYHGGFKAVVVEGSESMNLEAQHCFLKTLEEPSGKAIIFLVSQKPEMMLPTILSRCQHIPLFRPTGLSQKAETTQEMEALLTALQGTLAERFAYAKEVESSGKNIVSLLKELERYLRHLMLIDIGVEKASRIERQYTLPQLKQNLTLISEIIKKLTVTNANQRLALEIVLMEL